MGKLSGTTALISGGARGMGASHARAIVAEGGQVVIGDILEVEGRTLETEIGERCRFAKLNVTIVDDWRRAVELADRQFGPINVLINNAGIVSRCTTESVTLDEWTSVVDVNLTGVFNGMQAVIPGMKRAGAGSIVNVSSSAGMIGYPGMAPYVASKWGVRGLTKAAAIELGHYGIRVNSIHPGAVRTFMAKDVPDDAFAHQPVPRIGECSEVTKLILYLITDATYSTGAEFIIDGGATLIGPTALLD